jgi:hypothetical protein
VVSRILRALHAERFCLDLLGNGLRSAANAPRHRKASYGVVARDGWVDVDFRLVDAIVTSERVYDPSDVPGAPHIA